MKWMSDPGTMTVNWKWDVKPGRMNQRSDNVKVQTDLGSNNGWKRWVIIKRRVNLTYRIAQLFKKTAPESRRMVSERSIDYFDTKVDCGTSKSNNTRWASKGVNLQVEKVVEIWRFFRLLCFVDERSVYWMRLASECKD